MNLIRYANPFTYLEYAWNTPDHIPYLSAWDFARSFFYVAICYFLLLAYAVSAMIAFALVILTLFAS